MKEVSGGITAAKGFLASGVFCGIRRNKTKKDLALIYSEKPCTAAAMYTQNKVKGAPIYVTMEHLEDGMCQAVICNSGNANTCNADGVEIAKKMCLALSDVLKIKQSDIIVASTGVIGQPLNVDVIISGIEPLVLSLSKEGAQNAAEAIMTTDTMKKEIAVEFEIGGKTAYIGGIAKGSGMINPNMATMLSFITTDANITSQMLKKALKASAEQTYNMVSVDGDTSTNDMVSVMANGEAGNPLIDSENGDYETFIKALNHVNTYLAKMMAKDGEGASKLIECTVKNACDIKTARLLAKSVIKSNLVKAAVFGADANWGRILCALGYADADFIPEKTDVYFKSEAGEVKVCENGMGLDFNEELAKNILQKSEIQINIDLKDGSASATAWGCDLTYDYVRINGDYRT